MRLIEFPTFAKHWSPIIASEAVGRGKPTAVEFDGIPVVLFRDQGGSIQALVDRCPHRSVKLSLGKMRPHGALQCAFHGLAFGGDGTCRSIPFNPNTNTESICAQRVAVAERGGLIWLNGTADPFTVSPLRTPDTLQTEGWFGSIIIRDWTCHWSRAIQTMLDVGHIPFVHPRSIGAAFGRALGKAGDAELVHDLQRAEDESFRVDWTLQTRDTTEAGDHGWVAFHPPNGMSLGIPQKHAERKSVLHIWCAPLDEKRSRMIVVSRRNFGRYAIIPRLYDILTPVILGEDRRNMETVWPSPVQTSGEVSLPSDVPTIEFQKYYRRRFQREAVAVEAH